MNRKKQLSGLLAGACLLISTHSYAAVFEWTLNNVVFDDGGSATGSFKVDIKDGSTPIDLDDIFDINIQASSGAAITNAITFDRVRSASFVPPFTGSPDYAVTSISFAASDNGQTDFENWLGFSFSFPWLSASNTSVSIETMSDDIVDGEIVDYFVSGQSIEDDMFDDYLLNNPFERGVISGSVTGVAVSAVPVPAAAWLFGSAIISLVGAVRRGGDA